MSISQQAHGGATCGSEATKYATKCFWLLVPILLFNLLFTPYLPAAYQPSIFWKDIPRALSIAENAFRGAVLFGPLLMPLSFRSQRQRIGLVLYVLGTLFYFGSWAMLIVAPRSGWSRSVMGFMAPAYTPALWLTGIGLVGERLVIPRFCYRPWMYGVLVGGFLLSHNLHAALVFARQ
jgi:hypothetical protein